MNSQSSKSKYSHWTRKFIHIDMDAFFAAVEQRDQPEYKGKPVIVGGNPKGRGVVSTCSYEARKYGIRSAMPAAQAFRLCPEGVFLRPNFEKYRIASAHVMAILHQHTDLVEPMSLDEAYLDVTQNKLGIKDPEMIAKLIKQNIFAVTKLTASAGVAPNMFLAKIASDFRKPDGLTVIAPEQILDFLRDLPVRKIPGVGPVTENRLKELNIHTCGELARQSEERLYEIFGKLGIFLSKRANGMDNSEIEIDTESKQYSTEETFEKDVKNIEVLKLKLEKFADEIFKDLSDRFRMGRTIVLKVKYFDFKQVTRSYTLNHFPKNAREIWEVACALLQEKTEAGVKPIRLLGLGVSGLTEPARQRVKFEQGELFDGELLN